MKKCSKEICNSEPLNCFENQSTESADGAGYSKFYRPHIGSTCHHFILMQPFSVLDIPFSALNSSFQCQKPMLIVISYL